jgi:hypothetical protein
MNTSNWVDRVPNKIGRFKLVDIDYSADGWVLYESVDDNNPDDTSVWHSITITYNSDDKLFHCRLFKHDLGIVCDNECKTLSESVAWIGDIFNDT